MLHRETNGLPDIANEIHKGSGILIVEAHLCYAANPNNISYECDALLDSYKYLITARTEEMLYDFHPYAGTSEEWDKILLGIDILVANVHLYMRGSQEKALERLNKIRDLIVGKRKIVSAREYISEKSGATVK